MHRLPTAKQRQTSEYEFARDISELLTERHGTNVKEDNSLAILTTIFKEIISKPFVGPILARFQSIQHGQVLQQHRSG